MLLSLPSDLLYSLLSYFPTSQILQFGLLNREFHHYTCSPKCYSLATLTILDAGGREMSRFEYISKLVVVGGRVEDSVLMCYPNLVSLVLNSCYFGSTGGLGNFIKKHRLIDVDLSNSKELDINFMISIFNNQTIKTLKLSQIIFDKLPYIEHTSTTNNIISLNLSFCVTLTHNHLNYFLSKSPYIKVLILSNCIRLNNNIINDLSYCKNLEILDLARINILPSLLIQLKIFNNLKELTIPTSCSTNEGFEYIYLLPKLELLKIAIGTHSLGFDDDTVESLLYKCPNLNIEVSICSIIHSDFHIEKFGNRAKNLHNCADHGGFIGSSVKNTILKYPVKFIR